MDRYKTIIDDWEAFRQQSENHPRQGIRRNPLKAKNDFEEKLGDTFDFEEPGWNSDVYRISHETPGKSMLHWRGEYYVQEESAALPVDVLDPQPGEKVLDMCAAPGGKSTQIAAEMENRGLVIANDSSAKRMKSLHANIYRTGSMIVDATNYDARNIPEDESFDRILVDAPCSGEGDRYYRNFEAVNESESRELSKLQLQILEKSADLVKEGGTVVYSTCTINPVENENVVEKAVENTDLELERIETGAEHVRGVKEFEEREFEEGDKCVRVYPHHLNSGVIFVARFRKKGSSEDEKTSGQLNSANKAEEYMEERFDVKAEEINLERINGDYWLASSESSELETETRGIRAVRDMDIGLKPTTYALQILQEEISKNVAKVSREDLEDFSEDRMIERDMEDSDCSCRESAESSSSPNCCGKGYVALEIDGRIIGCGFYMDGLISSRIPEGRLAELVDTF